MGDIVGSVCHLICVSSEIFQKRVHQELQGLPGVKCIADDILIHGTCEADDDSNLDGFMRGCQQKGIELNAENLEYKCKEVSFHGHLLTTEVLKPEPEKVRAIIEMPRREYEQGQRKETLISHEAPSRPWQFVAAGLFELNGKSYLVTVDYFSDFFELDHLRSTSSVYVIKKLKGHFARHGILEQLVTDNGPQFVSHNFLKFP